MDHNKSNLPESQLDRKLELLSARVDGLIEAVERLRRDNRELRDREKHLDEEKTRLAIKNQEAKKRLAAIITRLRQQGGDAG